MSRSRPPDRFRKLVEAATGVFIQQGYRRTQIADVARELRIGKGTVYLYVESKDALFDAALRWADRSEVAEPAHLPVKTPKRGTTLRYVRQRLEQEGQLPTLQAALRRRRVKDTRAELESVVRELYSVLEANRVGLKLIDCCAPDYPELAEMFYGIARVGVPGLLQAYLDARIDRGAFRPLSNSAIGARIIMETATFWAVHRHWDPAPQRIDARDAEQTVVEFITGALLR